MKITFFSKKKKKTFKIGQTNIVLKLKRKCVGMAQFIFTHKDIPL